MLYDTIARAETIYKIYRIITTNAHRYYVGGLYTCVDLQYVSKCHGHFQKVLKYKT